MTSPKDGAQSELFTVRVWHEQVENGTIEWRGKVQHVVSGDQQYFRDWTALVAFLTSEAELREDGRRVTSDE
jgi:hypothetical protein